MYTFDATIGAETFDGGAALPDDCEEAGGGVAGGAGDSALRKLMLECVRFNVSGQVRNGGSTTWLKPPEREPLFTRRTTAAVPIVAARKSPRTVRGIGAMTDVRTPS
jgi:hypothetical protein